MPQPWNAKKSLHCAVRTTAVYNLNVIPCAEFLDACWRADNSCINVRLREKLQQYHIAPSFAVEDIQVQVPVAEIEGELGQAAPSS